MQPDSDSNSSLDHIFTVHSILFNRRSGCGCEEEAWLSHQRARGGWKVRPWVRRSECKEGPSPQEKESASLVQHTDVLLIVRKVLVPLGIRAVTLMYLRLEVVVNVVEVVHHEQAAFLTNPAGETLPLQQSWRPTPSYHQLLALQAGYKLCQPLRDVMQQCLRDVAGTRTRPILDTAIFISTEDSNTNQPIVYAAFW